MTDPKEKIAAWMREQCEEAAWTITNMTIGDSPIENALFVAIRAWLWAHCMPFAMPRCGGEYGAPEEVFDKRPTAAFLYETQAQIENFRVDFVFHQKGEMGGTRGLVVECDGHDFHERTKEQAIADRSRDRRLQELGYTVYRFTGSEIYNDPMRCATQVLAWVEVAW